MSNPANLEIATFANGCFWCTEAVFQELKGVEKVTNGYTGGHVPDPTYEQVCNKDTGHAESLRIEFNPKQISFDELLEVFWKTHDPTTPNRQGNDIGPQYRSAIFYHNEEQKEKAERYKVELETSGVFNSPIVTTIEPASVFYPAEGYHESYYKRNPTQSYCYYVIKPKMEKFKKIFGNKIKSED